MDYRVFSSHDDRYTLPEDLNGKRIFICNTASLGAILATTCVIRFLKQRGARIAFGTRLNNLSGAMFANNQDCEVVADACPGSGQTAKIYDPEFTQWFDNADYRLNQTYYQDTVGRTCYTERLAQAGILGGSRGWRDEDVRGHLYLTREAMAIAAEWVDRERLTPGMFLAVHVGATNPNRRWHTPHLERLAFMCAQRGLPVVQIWSPAFGERPARSEHVIPIERNIPLSVACSICAHAGIMLTSDSLFSHVALALQKPTVHLYSGETRPDMRVAAHHRNALHLWKPEAFPEMKNVEPEPAFNLIERLASNLGAPAAGAALSVAGAPKTEVPAQQ